MRSAGNRAPEQKQNRWFRLDRPDDIAYLAYRLMVSTVQRPPEIGPDGRAYNPELVTWGMNGQGERRLIITAESMTEFGRARRISGAQGLSLRTARAYRDAGFEPCMTLDRRVYGIDVGRVEEYLGVLQDPEERPEGTAGKMSTAFLKLVCNELIVPVASQEVAESN